MANKDVFISVNDLITKMNTYWLEKKNEEFIQIMNILLDNKISLSVNFWDEVPLAQCCYPEC